jgi:NADH-quinone oxidoreductase subunit F
MDRLKSPREFAELQERLRFARDPSTPVIVISAGTCGQASGANDLIRIAKKELLRRGLADRVHLRVTGCHGYCESEPAVLVEPGRTYYPKVGLEAMARIIDAVAQGEVVEDLVYVDRSTGKRIPRQDDIPFFRRQVRTILSRNERVDPIRITDYVESGGYAALAGILERRAPSAVIDEVKRSGLRGRGGAGFPTGLKWELLANQADGRGKFLVCNADEGDPGAYMDRAVLEGSPHSIIEGMLIGAFATGATEGVIYVRNEYPLAIKHLIIALRQARELGLLGADILGTGFSFDINLVRGAGAFVCGEETALMRSIEGKMGEPRQRPPFPVQKGIDGRPTAINNVETWANIPVIFDVGAEAYARVGTPGNAGTKIFSLVGKVRNTGLVEVPMGTTIAEIVDGIGGGAIGTSSVKAVQTGGPSGGCIPTPMFSLPIDYDSLAQAGTIMGSGGMIVMDENTCMVDVAKYFMSFLKDESCGKCFTCRKGTQRMWELLDDISRGQGTLAHLGLLEELALVVKDTTMCGLGQTAANPVLSTLRYFRKEYERHIVERRCDAFVCQELTGAPCQSSCPLGTEAWRYIAHVARGEVEEAYFAIREANPFPSVCARVCNHPCEERCRAGSTGGDPVAVRALKRYVTDRVDPMLFRPTRTPVAGAEGTPIAVVGSGPAGLTAAHYLSLMGYPVTVLEADPEPGGMLFSAIPAYRLPREVVRKEIASLLDQNITLRCNTMLGRDVTLDGLLEEGFKAVFVALGAHKSLTLGLPGEDSAGVFPSISFLKAFNQRGERLARGRVGVIGGGNSAVDAARVALRQPAVESVTIFYRRTLHEMPAFAEEVEAALQEGVNIEPLAAPVRILTKDSRLIGIECVKNSLGTLDESGRRRPVPVPGSEYIVPLDTLIVAISEGSDTDCIAVAGANRVEVSTAGTVRADPESLATNRPGVFAGGDVVTGPNTVVDAIAAGKKAAVVIDRYVRGEPLVQPRRPRLPEIYVEPLVPEGEGTPTARAATPRLSIPARRRSFAEVETSLSPADAVREARRCLRCDLAFFRGEVSRPPLGAEVNSAPSPLRAGDPVGAPGPCGSRNSAGSQGGRP